MAAALPAFIMALIFLAVAHFGVTVGPGQTCVTGYIMDVFCIDRGRLLDTGDATLTYPERHSVHCLVDVSVCYNSGFEVLTPPPAGSMTYTRFARLDSSGVSEVIELARANGACGTCQGGYGNGKQNRGWRSTVVGVLDTSTTPPLLDTSSGGVYLSSEMCEGMQSAPLPPSPPPLIASPPPPRAPPMSPGLTCVTGYIMDVFCIDRGRLLDTGDATLTYPERHSVHCLVDVSVCYNSGFEVLTPPPAGSMTYTRFARLDSSGVSEVIELARANGACGTCQGGYGNGKQNRGWRSTVVGVLDASTTPPLLDTSVSGGGVYLESVGCMGTAASPSPAPPLSSSPASPAAPPPLVYERSEITGYDWKLSPQGAPDGFTLHWGGLPSSGRRMQSQSSAAAATPTELRVRVQAEITMGWLGLGFSTNGQMVGSDAVIGWMDASSGVPSVGFYALVRARHRRAPIAACHPPACALTMQPPHIPTRALTIQPPPLPCARCLTSKCAAAATLRALPDLQMCEHAPCGRWVGCAGRPSHGRHPQDRERPERQQPDHPDRQ